MIELRVDTGEKRGRDMGESRSKRGEAGRELRREVSGSGPGAGKEIHGRSRKTETSFKVNPTKRRPKRHNARQDSLGENGTRV